MSTPEKTVDELTAALRQLQEEHAKELDLQEQRYQLLYEKNPTMFFTVGMDGLVLSVNEFGASSLGYSKQELLGQQVWNVFHPDDIPFVKKSVAKALRSDHKISQWEFRKIHKDGSVIWIRENVQIIRPEGEEPFLL
ncbi:MAG: PAS domain S-box protein, partial [Bacteroidota bacterium]